ncbi:MAG: hypothetical protein AAF985_19720 [Bacteroidota bacterium]
MMFFNNNELKQLCKLDVQLEEKNLEDTFLLNQRIKGTLYLTPKSDLVIHHLGYQLMVEARGKVMHYLQTIFKSSLSKQSTLNKDQTYSFPFELINKTHESYKGINTNHHIKLEFFLRLKEKKLEKKDRGFLSKMNHLLKWDDQYKSAYYLHFKSNSRSYKIQRINENLEMTYSDYIQFGLSILVVLLLIVTLNSGSSSSLMLGIIVILFLAVVYFLLLEQIVGPIIIQYPKDSTDGQLCIQLRNTKKWRNVRHISIRYEVREEVVDRRGTSTETLTRTIFTSEEKSLKNPTQKVRFHFDFPADMMGTTRVQDSNIYWVVVVRVKTIWGISTYYENVFSAVKNEDQHSSLH